MPERLIDLQPYPFSQEDTSPEKLTGGVEHTLANFYLWRDSFPERIAEHINSYTDQLTIAEREYGGAASLKRRLLPSVKETFRKKNVERNLGFFCVYNLAEMPDSDTLEKFGRAFSRHPFDVNELQRIADRNPSLGVAELVGEYIPNLKDQPELMWLEDQFVRLRRILPEHVIQNGGIGKAARTVAGVLTIGLYDTLHEPQAVQKEHLTHILPAAYAYGAMYPIIDDTLHDSSYVSADDTQRYHEIILEGIRTGGAVDLHALPDHPLAEELERIYNLLLESFPFSEHRHLYRAGESMYLAQYRDSQLSSESVSLRGLQSMYPDIFIKAAMTRVVANSIGRRTLGDSYFKKAVNINFINQFRDDLQDYREDVREHRLTPFTYDRAPHDTSPLYDLFAYSAYISEHVFCSEPIAGDILMSFSAHRLAVHFLKDPEYAKQLMEDESTTAEMRRFIGRAVHLPSRVSNALKRPDLQFQDTVAAISKAREQTEVDPRTFISDRVAYINDVVRQFAYKFNTLSEVAAYALDAGGKRVRPALTLMLAEGLDVPYRSVEPLLKAVELFHTASLIFDDLPAQDNAKLRRGKPTTHMKFGEDRAQLAGISLLSSGFGALSELYKTYSNEKVSEILEYFGSVLGPERLCLGQDMDLHMTRDEKMFSIEEIIEMYNLKTSTLIEASLVPVMILEERPVKEIELIKKYSYHAGIVFQLRDDILDNTTSSEVLGKDANHDINKVNIARVGGLSYARALLDEHLEAALTCCSEVSFDTTLLEGIVQYFADRKR